VDTFWSDLVSDLELTTEGFRAMVEVVGDLSLPWLAREEGGVDVRNVPRA
jgi:acetoin utilization deacetylase AcuC-like enzyme